MSSLRERFSVGRMAVLASCLWLGGCGGTAPNTVSPPAASNYSTRSEEMRKNYGGKQTNQQDVNKAIQEAKQQSN